MENMTIEEKADEYIKQYLPHVDTTGHWLGFQDGYKQALSESSGSVAAPKPKTEGRWFKDWKKITEAVIPKGPMCRDCADEDGTCPNNDVLPCDPTDEVIERFKRLRQQLEGMKSILKEIEFQVYAEGWSPQERLAEIKKKFPKR